MSSAHRVLYRPAAIARRIRALAKQINRDYNGQTLDVVCVINTGYLFMADLVRRLTVPTRVHFLQTETRDTLDPNTGKERREIFYTPELVLRDLDVLVIDGVIDSGITSDFLLRRLTLRGPRSVKLAVCVDKHIQRRVFLEPDYAAFKLASPQVVIGYGLAWGGLYGNLPYVAALGSDRAARQPAPKAPARRAARPARARAGRK